MTRRAKGVLAALLLAGAGVLVAEGVGAPRIGTRTRPSGTRGPASATAPASRPADPNATQTGPWTDANVGATLRVEREGNMVQALEVVKGDESTVTVRTTLNVEGVKPTEQVWPRRLMPEELRLTMEAFGRKSGQEPLTVGDEGLACTVYQREMSFGRTKVLNKTWVCKDVPGWVVRVDNDARGAMATIFRVTEIRK